VASANQGGWRLIAVLLNSDGVWEDAQALLDYGFANWEASIFADMEKPLLTVGVLGGRNKAPLVPVDTLIDLRARGEHGQVEKAITLDRLVAPIKMGQRVGRVRLLRGEREIGATWLVAGAKVERASWFTILLIIGRVLLILAIALGGLKGYGKIAKAARRRRHRLQAQSRTVDSGRTSKRGWPDYQAPGREGGPGQE
jgi:D-alanyl-D-alanine carboxypeptidase (penicillin-binding protein 5/6)